MDDEDLLGYIPEDDIEDDYEEPSRTYHLDLENGRIDGKIDGLDAIHQAITKALITPRFKCLIYSDDYGSEIQDELDTSPSEGYVITILPDTIKDALIVDDRIIDVGDFEIEIQGDNAHISFTAYTIYGDIEIEEVI